MTGSDLHQRKSHVLSIRANVINILDNITSVQIAGSK